MSTKTNILAIAVAAPVVFAIAFLGFRTMYPGATWRDALDAFQKDSPFSLTTLFWAPFILVLGAILFAIWFGIVNS